MSETRRPDPAGTRWLRSARCGNSSCVEVARIGDEVGVRDSKNPGGPVLRFDAAEFRAFVEAAKAGEFDPLYS